MERWSGGAADVHFVCTGTGAGGAAALTRGDGVGLALHLNLPTLGATGTAGAADGAARGPDDVSTTPKHEGGNENKTKW